MCRYQDVMAVTNRNLCIPTEQEKDSIELLCLQMKRVCSVKPRAVILREKDLTEKEYERLAERVSQICGENGVDCIYHTFVNAAVRAGVKKIHLPLWKLEELADDPVLQTFEVIGASIHSVEEALRAERLGATYITAGHIYVTGCKEGLAPRGLDFLEEVCRAVKIPVWAIGGIGLDGEQLDEVKERGAEGGCIMSAMMHI